jgi:hypothetical protein
MVVICGAGNANSLEAHGSPRVYYCWSLYSQTCCFIFTSVVSSINVEAHRWCCGCRGSIGGVVVVVVASVVLWLSWSHRWCYGCRGNIGGVMIVVDASVVLWLSW